jgi:hypothetical protein
LLQELVPVQNLRLRRQIAFGACALMVILAAASFFACDHKAAAIIATQALLAGCVTVAATKRDLARGRRV